MFGFTRRIIMVAFVDGATGRIISSSKMPLERLPDTFAIDTELNMDGARYVVVRAEPPTKDEFRRNRYLKVTLRKRAAFP
jgi:hypothetical protein